MKRYILSLSLMLILGISVKGQQVVLYNQYQIDPYNLNPAFSGMDEKVHLNICFRKQWLGFSNSPATYYFSGHSRLGERTPQPYNQYSLRISKPERYESMFGSKKTKINHAIGGTIQSDALGAFTRLSAGLTYAAQIKLTPKYSLGVGLLAGLLNYSFDDEGLILAFPDDQTYSDFMSQNTSSAFMNLNAGLVLYSDKIELQYAAQQLLRNQIWFVKNSGVIDLQVHHFLGFAYNIHLQPKKMMIKPSVMFRYVQDMPFSLDINLLTEFDQKYWAGLSYRLNNAIVALAGINYKQFKFGYAFDYNSSALRKASTGSHEIFMGMNF